jgi:hypothetical protein
MSLVRVATASCVAAFLLALILASQAWSASGTWERSWGKDVLNNGSEIGAEVCTVAASCRSGLIGGLGGELSEVEGVAVDSKGNVYVADFADLRVDKFTAAGVWQRSWGGDVVAGNSSEGPEICTVASQCKSGLSGDDGGELGAPVGVATDPGGNVYVVESGFHRVQKFDSSGNFLLAWGKNVSASTGSGEAEICSQSEDCQLGEAGEKGGEFNDPDGIGTDSSGNVYVADYENGRVQKFNSSGVFQATWGQDVIGDLPNIYEVCVVASACKAGSTGGLGGQLNKPVGIAVVADKVFVGDSGNNRVQEFDVGGGWTRAWGKDVDSSAGTGFEVCATAENCKTGVGGGGEAGQFAGGPYGMAADGSGKVYAADLTNNRIQVFNENTGAFEAAWGKDVIKVGGSGDIGEGFEICTVVADCKVGVAGFLGGELNQPFGLSVDSGGNVFVGDRGNLRIDRFSDFGPPPPPGGQEEGGGASGGGTGGGTGATDSTAPKLGLSRKAKQRVGKLSVTVTGDEAGTLKGQAAVPIPGGRPAKSKSASAAIKAGQKVILRLKFADKALKSINNALKAGKHLKANITVVGKDTAGNSSIQRTSVKLLP